MFQISQQTQYKHSKRKNSYFFKCQHQIFTSLKSLPHTCTPTYYHKLKLRVDKQTELARDRHETIFTGWLEKDQSYKG